MFLPTLVKATGVAVSPLPPPSGLGPFYCSMESKLKTPTCNRCKTRKIRCDGSSSCHMCTTAGASCEYDNDSKDDHSMSELRKGAACLACQRKKKVGAIFGENMQTATLLALYFFNKGDIARSHSILRTASQIVLNHNLDTTMLYPEPPVPTKAMSTAFKPTLATRAEEGQAVLSQLIYLDLSQRVLLQLPSVIDPQVYAHFRTSITTHCISTLTETSQHPSRNQLRANTATVFEGQNSRANI
ncbi:hypothetical protein B0H17DRAFT_1184858 [Mycena rosella]|uniref:Zn(2)-C6 fungal-type domain-containing protein n=1 Tax=Mycena rosella TaxID=1033263 RepID=A0AAD7CXT1_MYCRO|nr:hypothetical protein B0H17DRAFT_1184858 [Mycena rosella]